jgi:glyoxylase-like metal-dependent hydrolase (beta-lactamase superfamily II)
MATNTYALLTDGKSLLVDAASGYLLPPIREIAGRGHAPAGLLLTHRHVAGNADILEAFQEEFGAPIFLHPIDAHHPQGARTGTEFRDPIGDPEGSALLAEFGVEAVLFPGQTEGSVMLYRGRDGLVLAGDSAMVPPKWQAQEGVERLVRPPVYTSADDGRLRHNWERFDRPVSHLGPFHGAAYVGSYAGKMEDIMRPLLRAEPTLGLEG